MDSAISLEIACSVTTAKLADSGSKEYEEALSGSDSGALE